MRWFGRRRSSPERKGRKVYPTRARAEGVARRVRVGGVRGACVTKVRRGGYRVDTILNYER